MPQHIQTMWKDILLQIKNIEKLQIPRWLTIAENNSYQLHLFCDASEAAYAANAYLRVVTGEKIVCNLIAAKTKVSPMKQISLPRLELSGAVLLARLAKKVMGILNMEAIDVHAWPDSEITLAWIHAHPSKWQTFVANRVTYIQNTMSKATWRHIPSGLSPADVTSRGSSPNELIHDAQWWHGPAFLTEPNDDWPK